MAITDPAAIHRRFIVKRLCRYDSPTDMVYMLGSRRTISGQRSSPHVETKVKMTKVAIVGLTKGSVIRQ